MSSPPPLDLPPEAFRALADQVLTHAERWLAERESAPASRMGDAAATAASAPFLVLPGEPRPAEELLALAFGPLAEAGIDTAGAGFFGYIPGGGLPTTALADLIGDLLNRYASASAPAPAMARLEESVVRWLCDVVGFGEGSLGVLTSGGSLATLTALVAARRTRLEDADLPRAVVYASDQAHHCLAKACLCAGVPEAQLRLLPADDRQRLDPTALADQIAADRAAGLAPLLLVASAGTTSSGAVDPIPALADLADAENLWLHVDAAYGGAFLLTERGRQVLAGVERADSVVLDPHKGLFLPYGTGALVVRDADLLRRGLAYSSAYMPDPTASLIDFHLLSPELTRSSRALRLWLPLMLHGVDAFRAALDARLDLAQHAATTLAADARFELLTPPELSLFAFRLRCPGASQTERNAENLALLERVNSRGEVYLSDTTLAGDRWLRLCVLALRTGRAQVDAALEALQT